MEIRNIKPVFIIGAGYSGTSILYKFLAMHPDFAWFSQYSCRGGEVPRRFKFPFYKYFNRILRSIFKHNWAKEVGRTKFVPRPGDVEQIWEYIFPEARNISNEEVVNRIKKIIVAESNNWRRNHFLSKSIRFHNFLPILNIAFPQAKFVHIIRDGRAITLSRKYKYKGEERGLERFLLRSKEWVGVIERINQQKGELDFLEFRYEDFCTDVRGYLKEVLIFAGLDPAKFPFDKCPETLRETNQKWFKMATKEEIDKIGDLQKEILRKYNYIK